MPTLLLGSVSTVDLAPLRDRFDKVYRATTGREVIDLFCEHQPELQAIVLCPPFLDTTVVELSTLLCCARGPVPPIVVSQPDRDASNAAIGVVKTRPECLGSVIDMLLPHGSRVQNRARSDLNLAHDFFVTYAEKSIKDSLKIAATLKGVGPMLFGDPALYYLTSKMGLEWETIVNEYESETLDTLAQPVPMRYWMVGSDDPCKRLSMAMPEGTLERTLETFAYRPVQLGVPTIDGVIFGHDRDVPSLSEGWAQDMDIVVLTDKPEWHIQADCVLPVQVDSPTFQRAMHRLMARRQWRMTVPRLTRRLSRQKVSFAIRIQMLDRLCRSLLIAEKSLSLRAVYAFFPEAAGNGQPSTTEVTPMTIQTGLKNWILQLCGTSGR